MPGPSAFAFVDQARNNLKKLESFITTGMDNCEDLSLDIVENGKDDADQDLSKLKSVMVDYIKMEKELKHFLEAVDAVKRLAKHSEDDLNLEELLDEKLAELSASDGEDFTKHPRYVDLESKISDLLSTVNPASCSVTAEELTEIDDDITLKQEMVTKCPYTGKEMRDPVRNIHCQHNYDREGIMEAMKLRKGKTRCPVPGCINDKLISASDLEENHELRRYIEKKSRQTDKKCKKS